MVRKVKLSRLLVFTDFCVFFPNSKCDWNHHTYKHKSILYILTLCGHFFNFKHFLTPCKMIFISFSFWIPNSCYLSQMRMKQNKTMHISVKREKQSPVTHFHISILFSVKLAFLYLLYLTRFFKTMSILWRTNKLKRRNYLWKVINASRTRRVKFSSFIY